MVCDFACDSVVRVRRYDVGTQCLGDAVALPNDCTSYVDIGAVCGFFILVICSQSTYSASPVTFTRCCLDQIYTTTHSLGRIQCVNSLKASLVGRYP